MVKAEEGKAALNWGEGVVLGVEVDELVVGEKVWGGKGEVGFD